MDKRKSILNVSVSVTFKLITMAMSIIVKRYLIQICGNEVNGLDALYLSIIGILSVAELGIGSAITFCMYKPIVEGNEAQVAALYRLFRRVYSVVAVIIFVAGLAITPFIHVLASDYTQIDVNLYSTFALMLVSVVITYLYSAKTSLINAYKNNYITTAITSGGIVMQYVLQLAALFVFGSFEAYLVCRIICSVTQWIATDIIARRKYKPVMSIKSRVDDENRVILMRSIRAMFMHKIGYLLVNTVDSVIISMFIGVVVLGEYSNYTTILGSVTSIISMVFTSLISVVGHMYVENSKQRSKEYFEAFHLMNYVIGCVFYMGFYAIIDNLITLFFGAELVIERSIAFVITVNGFVQFMRRSALMFREATGTFYHDRWKPVAEGITNIVLSIIFVKIMGVEGVIVATILTNLMICHIVEPYVLYKNALDSKPFNFYMRNYLMMAAFVAVMLIFEKCMWRGDGEVRQLLINGTLSVMVSSAICGVVLYLNRSRLNNVFKLRRKGC